MSVCEYVCMCMSMCVDACMYVLVSRASPSYDKTEKVLMNRITFACLCGMYVASLNMILLTTKYTFTRHIMLQFTDIYHILVGTRS